MSVVGYIVAVFLIAGTVIIVFTDFQTTRNVEHLSNEERMEALGRVVAISRRRNNE